MARVVLFGGKAGDAGVPLNSAAIFDPRRAGFTSGSTKLMNAARIYGAVAQMADGRFLLAGGYSGSENLTTAEIFDPATGYFTAANGNMAHG